MSPAGLEAAASSGSLDRLRLRPVAVPLFADDMLARRGELWREVSMWLLSGVVHNKQGGCFQAWAYGPHCDLIDPAWVPAASFCMLCVVVLLSLKFLDST